MDPRETNHTRANSDTTLHLHKTDRGRISLHTRAHTAPCIGDPTTTAHDPPMHTAFLHHPDPRGDPGGLHARDSQGGGVGARKREEAEHTTRTQDPHWGDPLGGRYIANGPREPPNGIILTHTVNHSSTHAESQSFALISHTLLLVPRPPNYKTSTYEPTVALCLQYTYTCTYTFSVSDELLVLVLVSVLV